MIFCIEDRCNMIERVSFIIVNYLAGGGGLVSWHHLFAPIKEQQLMGSDLVGGLSWVFPIFFFFTAKASIPVTA